MIELLPQKATFAPGDEIAVEVRGGAAPVELELWHLDRIVARAATDTRGVAVFPPQAEGGYGVHGGGAASALDVLADPLRRPRYGFVSRYPAGGDSVAVAEHARRLHLNAVQFYDWMYRHASLLPPEDDFVDALGQRISLETVRQLAGSLTDVGSLPLGYAAVYAVGREARDEWDDAALLRGDGSQWMLGDFLWNVDPTNERWLTHFASNLRAARDAVGFAGFHLDQYGAPKRAARRDGSEVDLADAFPRLLQRLDGELPDAHLIFNNVNDFPTWSTAPVTTAPVYVEVWAPHVRLRHVGELIAKARALAPGHGVILAAYLSCYRGDAAGARAAERLQHAVAYSHGGSVLLHGEAGAVLTEAYYVHHHELDSESISSARRCYDFAVRYGDLLFDPDSVDITRTHLGGVNEDVRVDAPVSVDVECEPGVLWTRVVRTSRGQLVHLIDLSQQADDLWDAPKTPARPLAGVRVSFERSTLSRRRYWFADPDASPSPTPLEQRSDERYDVVEVPPFGPWGFVFAQDDEED